jgi:DNA-binding transcriptional ArsR family regulator
MKQWQKILLDPAAYTLLKQLDQPKTKEELTESTGIQKERIQKLIKKLEENKLITSKRDKKTRKYSLTQKKERIKQLRLEIEDCTTKNIENSVKNRKYDEAKQKIHRKPLVDNLEKRKTLAKIEALQKLEKIPQTNQRKQRPRLLQSLKNLNKSK